MPTYMFCANCGAAISADASFCSRCGRRRDDATSSPSPSLSQPSSLKKATGQQEPFKAGAIVFAVVSIAVVGAVLFRAFAVSHHGSSGTSNSSGDTTQGTEVSNSVTVPNVIALEVHKAADQLHAAGFGYRSVRLSGSPFFAQCVIRTDPDFGIDVPRGETVILYTQLC